MSFRITVTPFYIRMCQAPPQPTREEEEEEEEGEIESIFEAIPRRAKFVLASTRTRHKVLTDRTLDTSDKLLGIS